MSVIRVFPRRTSATPDDELAYVGERGLFVPEVAEIHVSCTFTSDIAEAERLARSWGRYGTPVRIGGPATGEAGGEFVPGKYVKFGYVITSRGCPNRCWFCSVWRREGTTIRELPITEGWNLLDDNILATSPEHRKAVFAMLKKSAKRYRQRVEFTGGLEAALLTPEIATELKELHPKQMFFAYDTPDDRDPLFAAGKMLKDAGFSWAGKSVRAYVLIGYPKDDLASADNRLLDTVKAGFWPMAMLYKADGYEPGKEWRKLQREWARPAIMNELVAQIKDFTE
jgi:hypothetical protein